MTPIVHITDKEQALLRENANMLDTINKQAVSIEKLRKVVEMKDLTIEALKADAERYQQLRRGQHWSVIDGIGDTLRAEQLDAAIDAAMKEQS